MDAQLRKTLTETAYYATASGVSRSGDPSFGSPVSFLCRTEPVVKYHGPQYVPRDGEDMETFTIVFTEVDIGRDSQVWLPGVSNSDTTLARRPYRYDVMRGPEGRISHYEIYI